MLGDSSGFSLVTGLAMQLLVVSLGAALVALLESWMELWLVISLAKKLEDWLVDELGVWWEKHLVLSMVISLVIK